MDKAMNDHFPAASPAPAENLAIGRIIEVDGTRFIAELLPSLSELTRVYDGEDYQIGQFGSIVKVHFGATLIYGMVNRIRLKTEFQAEKGLVSTASSDWRIIEADLFGEGRYEGASGCFRFERGVSTYPLPLQPVYLTPKNELRVIYGSGKGAGICLGTYVGSGGTECIADLSELVGKHTAILGATGTGKSGTVASVLHGILDRGKNQEYGEWKPKIIILDPHGEYGGAFPGAREISTNDDSLYLPFWLLDFQETVDLLIGGVAHSATIQKNIVKNALLHSREEGCVKIGLTPDDITIDSPVPYKMATFIKYVQGDMPPQPSKQDSHLRILEKIESLRRDSRLNFMMAEWDDEDDYLPGIIKKLAGENPQPRIVDLSSVPDEVAGITGAMIARILFNMKVWQTQEERQNSPVLLVCEEAHRYIPNAKEEQYASAQHAIRRIAKEGRKYGIGLFVVSQRPGEVEATVLSQCNSWIVLRVTNSNDKEHVRAILPDSLSGLTRMLSGLRQQEAIFVGQAATLPSRIRIGDLPPERLPRSNDVDFDKGWQAPEMTDGDIDKVIFRWRCQLRGESDSS